ncbi:sulfotransferase [Dyella dinghuensis]|uniref:Sulfotransferase n=1 Tax=Dyella dinghuensis TaxID=1920169 RepID=A0A432LY39_9GAMM|nr:sulfotransferase [Dyella dinghuensis]RUL67167.1 sulfotransferase [Dyella dinghuensis]
MQRTFVVGCPRSGTTIVQAMLARHPEVFTLPETGFFPRLLGGLHYRLGDEGARPARRSLARRLGLTRRYGRREFLALQRSLLGDENQSKRAPLFLETCVEHFGDMLDGLAAKAGRSAWIEKTPHHLLYLFEIEQHMPDARFIHVIRPGMDVLASITDAELRYDNKSFGGGLMQWIRRWNRAAEIHRSCIGARNHHLVFLEDLTRNPADEWHRLCRFLGLSTSVELDQTCHQNIADPKVEPWKRDALSGLPQQSDSKVENLFGPQLREWLRERLSSYEELYAASSLAYNREDYFLTPDQMPKMLPVETADTEADAAAGHTATGGRYRVA